MVQPIYNKTLPCVDDFVSACAAKREYGIYSKDFKALARLDGLCFSGLCYVPVHRIKEAQEAVK